VPLIEPRVRVTSCVLPPECYGEGGRKGGSPRRRRPTRAVQERKPPFSVGIDSGTTLPHASIREAEGTPCVPKVAACANTRGGSAHVFPLWAEAPGQATPAAVMVGCEATGPYGLSL
jgi:hypothetical protein